jgi:hypothetical protein
MVTSVSWFPGKCGLHLDNHVVTRELGINFHYLFFDQPKYISTSIWLPEFFRK